MKKTRRSPEDWTNFELEYSSSSLSLRQLCKKHGVAVSSARYYTKSRGLPPRSRKKFVDNENFFSQIDTEDKAYVLGFLYADGSIGVCKNNIPSSISVCLAEKDVDILGKIRDLLSPNKPLTTVTAKREGKIFKYVSLRIWNRKIVQDLMALGCGPRKSLVLEFPSHSQVPAHLFHHFLRGIFDGDGHFSFSLAVNFRPNAVVHIESSSMFCAEFKKFIWRELNMNSYIRKTGRSRSRGVNLCGNKKIVKFMNYLYDNSTIYLKRKREKYDEFVELYAPYAATPHSYNWRPNKQELPDA